MAAQGDLSGDRLELRVREARGLPQINGEDPSCNITIEFGMEKRSTEMIARTRNPEWDKTKMYVFSNVAEQDVEYMVFKVVHKDMVTFRDVVIGVVPVELATAMNSPNITQDMWHPLRKTGETSIDSALGELRIQITYMMDDIEVEDDQEFDEATVRRKPNYLELTLEKGRNLKIPPGQKSIDPEATVTVVGTSRSTSCVRDDTNPRWNWMGNFNIHEADWDIVIVVRDRSRLAKPVIGRCRVTMTELLAEQPFKSWLKLLDNQYRFGPEPLGEVLLGATFTYSKKARKLLPSFKFGRSVPKVDRRDTALVQEAELDRLGTESEEAGASGPVAVAMYGEEREAWDREQAQKQSVLLKEQQLYQKRLSKIQPGDYQVQVHVIEARDLKPQDSSGTSDPFVFIKSSIGGAQKTATQKKNNSPLFDERLVFNYKDLTRQALQEATLTVCVYDEDWWGLSRQMIGSCSFDLLGIYTKNDSHEIYRAWVGLTDTEENNDEVGVQGFLRLSITVLGPGDAIPVHNLEEEIKEEAQKALEDPTAEGTIQYARKQTLQYIALSVFRAEELLTTPNLLLTSRVYVKLEFSGNHKKSKSYAVSGAVFNEQLWVPVYVPTMATRVVLSIWKKGGAFNADVPLGHHYFDFSKIKKCKREKNLKDYLKKEGAHKWVNIYGSAVKGVKKKGLIGGGLTQQAKQMAKYSNEASTYRGRVLVSIRTVVRPPTDFNNVPMSRSIESKAASLPPPEVALYTLRAFLIQGCEIPVFKKLLPDLDEGSLTARMKIKISIGKNSVEWPLRTNDKGMVVWNEMQEQRNIEFPVDFEMIPDVMIYLLRETDNTPVSFLRVPAVELLAEHFGAPPKFFHLQPDSARQSALGEAEYAGSVSIKLGFGRDEVARQNPWPDFSAQEELRAFCLRVHVYQARSLPASDERGTLDPYVKVRFNGNKVKTSIKEQTCDPCWFETLEIDGNKLVMPDDPDFCPEIVVRVWDNDGMFAKNLPVCGFHLPLKEAVREVGATNSVPEPKWYECFMCSDTKEEPKEEGNKKGELLISFQLIPKRTMNEVIKPDIEKLVLQPKYKLGWLDIVVWGVRDLQGGSNPYARFDIVGSDGRLTSYKSKRSSKPTGRNANFLEHIVTSIELPEDILFTPQLNVRVYDNIYGGLKTELIGSISVPLENKLPWSPDYEPPQNEAFESPVEVDATKLKVLQRRANASKGQEEEDSDEEDANEEIMEEAGSEDEPEFQNVEDLDPGLGAFDFRSQMTSSNTWVVPEDNQHKAVGKLIREADNGFFGDWFGSKEAEFDESGDEPVKNDLPDPRELGIDIPDSWADKEWLEDRDGWMSSGGSDLEGLLKVSPFENYPLKKGCIKSNGQSTVRQVGKFKGIISISEMKNEKPLVPLERVADYVARLYLWKADSLQPCDPSGKADPYIKCQLGSWSESGRKEHQKATLSPEFYKSYEIPIKMPGESQLKLSVFDWDRFHMPGTSDTLIGETIVDLEDRYYHNTWKALGVGTDQASTTGPPKPIEARDLAHPTTSTSQGKLYMWLEILPAGEARMRPPVNFERPPEMKIEVRVIVWAMTGYSTSERSVDYFVKTYLKGDARRKRETDTHWRSKSGSAQWNWRHKHVVEVPLDMPDKGDLIVELWDRDIISASDSLGAFTLPLSDWLKKCYIEQRLIKPFEEINEKLNGKADEAAAAAAADIQAAEEGADELEDEADNDGDAEKGAAGKEPTIVNPMNHDSGFEDDLFNVEDEQKPVGTETEKSPGDEEDDSEAEDEEGEEHALIKKEKKQDKKMKKPENIVDVLRELVGLPVSRDDAHWFDCGVMDVESGEYRQNGQLYITVELVPFEQAEASPVGSGRSEPNTNPYLPPPAGRLKIGLDPCSILCALFYEYPGICCCLCCCCCFVLLMGAMMVFSTYISAFSALGI